MDCHKRTFYLFKKKKSVFKRSKSWFVTIHGYKLRPISSFLKAIIRERKRKYYIYFYNHVINKSQLTAKSLRFADHSSTLKLVLKYCYRQFTLQKELKIS